MSPVWCLLLAACRGPAEPELPSTPPPPVPTPAPAAEVEVEVIETWNPLARTLVVTPPEPAPVVVGCVDAADPEGDPHLLTADDADAQHTLHLLGLRPDTTWDCRAAVSEPPGPVTAFELVTAPLEGIVPVATTTPDPPAGYVLGAYKTDACSLTTTLTIWDSGGAIRWRWEIPGPTQVDVEAVLRDGRVVWGGGRRVDGAGIVDLVEGEVYRAALPGAYAIHHDTLALDDGRLLTLEERPISWQGSDFVGFGLRLHDPETGIVDWEYDSIAALEDGVLQPGFVDPWHANALARHDDPVAGAQVSVALCYTSQILVIDEDTGTLAHVLGPGGDLELEAGRWPECQHGHELDGDTLLTYDNGLFTGASSVAEYALDLGAATAAETWRWTEPGWFEETLGDVDRLDDGEVLLTKAHPECWSLGSPGAHTEVLRIDPETDAVPWRLTFTDPQDTLYRAEWIDGCALFSSAARCEATAARWATARPWLYGDHTAW